LRFSNPKPVVLDERARVEQQIEPFPGGELALLVLSGHRALRGGMLGLVQAPAQHLKLRLRRVRHRNSDQRQRRRL
jgi:hypothetical protein